MNRRVFSVVAAFLSILVSAAAAQAATYYVSTSGSDSNSGSLSSPFATIYKANSVVKAGDVVYVRGGVYNALVSISAAGTSSARILFSSYPGETAVIDGTGLGSDKNLVYFGSSANYVDWSGFEVRNATRIGLLVYGGKNIGLYNNRVHSSTRNGIYIGSSSSAKTTDVVVDGNLVYNNVLENQNHSLSSGWAQAIGVSKSDRVRVTSNRIYQNYGEGLDFILSDYGYAAHNEIRDNFSVQMYLDNAQYTTIEQNFIYSSGDTRFYRGGYPAHGIGLANESYSTSNPLSDLKIINNIVLNSRWALYYQDYEAGGGLKNTLVANNTFYNATHAMVAMDADAHNNSYIQSNVFYQASSGSMTYGTTSSGLTFRHNNWYGGSAGFAAGSGDIVGDPKLTQPGGLTAPDYKLRSDSIVLAKGVVTSDVAQDYFEALRNGTNDIGAHHLGSDTTSTTDTQAPSTPSGLAASALSSSEIALSWNASTDDVGVAGYKIYRDGSYLTTVSGTSYTNGGLASATSYSYRVSAYDAAGNESALSSSVSATTLSVTLLKMRVADVSIQTSSGGKWNYFTPSVIVTDEYGNPVSDVTVTGEWSGILSGTHTATTDSTGTAQFSSSRTSSTGSATFTVTNLSHGSYVYDSSLNLETSATASTSTSGGGGGKTRPVKGKK